MKYDYQTLRAIETLVGFTQAEQIEIIGKLFDAAFYDAQDIEGVKLAFNLANDIAYAELDEHLKVVFHYDLSNGWEYLRKLEMKPGSKEVWNFQSIELTKQVFHLRKAKSLPGFQSIQLERRCQILTNLGNSMNHIGRFVEAQRAWSEALELIPYFPMALANRAHGLLHYGMYHYDPAQRHLFLRLSHLEFEKAFSLSKYLDPGAEEFFRRMSGVIETMVSAKTLAKPPKLNNASLGRSKKLREYRQWCLRHHLYLNSLNDVGAFTDGSNDYLHLPPILTQKFDEPLVFFALFNQIKQEYTTARHLLYEGTQLQAPHYADVDSSLFDAVPGFIHSYSLEQTKAAMRMAYSIFDKVAYFMNLYVGLGIPPNKVSFRRIWYDEKRSLRPFFDKLDNWGFRGLFWLSKDLFDEAIEEVMEPEAQELDDIRNHLEHKSLQVLRSNPLFPEILEVFKGSTHILTRDELEAKSLKLIALAREAMMYLCMAVHNEERKKEVPKGKTMTVTLRDIPKNRRN